MWSNGMTHRYPIGTNVWLIGSPMLCHVVAHLPVFRGEPWYLVNEGSSFAAQHERQAAESELERLEPIDRDDLPF